MSVFCGADGTARVYEDDGDSSAFQAGAYGWTTISTSTPDPTRCLLRISAVEGRPVTDRRGYTVRFEHTAAPTQVLLDGAVHGDWRHDGAATVVEVPAGPRDRDLHLSVSADGPLSRRGADHDQQLRARDLSRLLGDGADISLAAVCALPADRPGRGGGDARAEAARAFRCSSTRHRTRRPPSSVTWSWAPRSKVRPPPWPPPGRSSAVRRSAGQHWSRRGWPTRPGAGQPGPVGPDPDAHPLVGRGDNHLGRRHHHQAALQRHVLGQRARLARTRRRRSRSAGRRGGPRRPGVCDAPAAWRRREVDVTDVDFGRLTDPYVMVFILDSGLAEEGANVAYAATTLSVPTARDVAFGYLSGADVGVYVDGAPVTADVSGTTSVSISRCTRRAVVPDRSGSKPVSTRCCSSAPRTPRRGSGTGISRPPASTRNHRPAIA